MWGSRSRRGSAVQLCHAPEDQTTRTHHDSKKRQSTRSNLNGPPCACGVGKWCARRGRGWENGVEEETKGSLPNGRQGVRCRDIATRRLAAGRPNQAAIAAATGRRSARHIGGSHLSVAAHVGKEACQRMISLSSDEAQVDPLRRGACGLTRACGSTSACG